jgi:hypothetical protein
MNLELINNCEKQILQTAEKLFKVNENMYAFDIYCQAALNRSLGLLDGFKKLASDDNFTSALALVRVHLDTLQRLYAFQLIEGSVDDVVNKILSGKRIRDFQNKLNGKKLTDSELNQQLSELENFKYVKQIYQTGNDFIHFSRSHLLSSFKIKETGEETNNYSGVVSKKSSMISKEEKKGAVYSMDEITKGIVFFIQSWIIQKESYPKESSHHAV